MLQQKEEIMSQNIKNNEKSRKIVVQPSLKSSIIMQYVLFQNVHGIYEMSTR